MCWCVLGAIIAKRGMYLPSSGPHICCGKDSITLLWTLAHRQCSCRCANFGQWKQVLRTGPARLFFLLLNK